MCVLKAGGRLTILSIMYTEFRIETLESAIIYSYMHDRHAGPQCLGLGVEQIDKRDEESNGVVTRSVFVFSFDRSLLSVLDYQASPASIWIHF